MYYAEFNRDWNLEMPLGNQNLLTAGLELIHPENGLATYKFEHLNYSENFNGNRHSVLASLKLNRWNLFTNSSVLNSESDISKSTFLRSFNRIQYIFDKQWEAVKLTLIHF